MSVSTLFTALPGTVIPLAEMTFRTTGYSVVGSGAAYYLRDDATVDAAYVTANPRSSIRLDDESGTTHGYRLSTGQSVTPFQFGAISAGSAANTSGSADQSVPLQAWCDFVATRDCDRASLGGGRFIIATGLILDFITANTANSLGNYAPYSNNIELNGRIEARNGSTGDRVLTIKNAVMGQNFSGRPRILGDDYIWPIALRGWNVGIHYQNCGPANFEGAIVEGFMYAGFETSMQPDNNNGITFGTLVAKRCGSGDDLGTTANAYSTTISSRQADTGSANSFNQLSTFTLAAMPVTTYIDEAVSGQLRRVIQVDIGGKLYLVKAIDRTNSRISIFPWAPAATTTGPVTWHFGGALVTRGNDSNVVNGNLIYALNCGSGLDCASLYGGFIGTILTQNCGVGLRLASDPSGQVFGGSIGDFYFEANNYDISLLGASTTNFKILAANGLTMSKISKGYEVYSGSTYSNSGLIGLDLPGNEGTWVRQPIRSNGGTQTLDVSKPAMDRAVWTAAASAWNFNLVALPAWMNELWLREGATIHVQPPNATSARGAPTSVQFTAPAGWTVNGSSAGGNFTFTDFSGPGSFRITGDPAALAFWVRRVGGGPLTAHASAVAGTIVPDKTLILYDASGTAYKVACVAA